MLEKDAPTRIVDNYSDSILNKLYRHTPSIGPEWGSGGIFGLRYYKGVLYYTLAFEARAYFLTRNSTKVYDFSKIGGPPQSGGDTYNAVTTIDDEIYFGGWVHAPGADKSKKLLCHDKYSHIHSYNVPSGEIELIWKDGPGGEDTWVGEISELVYDELNNQIFAARGDGHDNLGLFALDLDTKKMRQISDEPALKGTLFLNYAVFNTGGFFFDELQYVDIDTGKYDTIELDKSEFASKDGESFEELAPLGSIGVAGTKLFVFRKGGIIFGDPFQEENDNEPKMSFLRLFDFPNTSISPFRVNALPVRGGILTAYNAFPDMLGLKSIPFVAPSVLLYITPPMIKIVGVFGARITSLEKAGSKILVAANTMPNTDKPIPMDSGSREISVLHDDILDNKPPALELTVPTKLVKTYHWGGIPLTGYNHRVLKIYASKPNTLTIWEYNFGFPLSGEQHKEEYKIQDGKNIIDLSGFMGVVSFQLSDYDEKGIVNISLQ